MNSMICNPLNLEYRYQIKKAPYGEGVFREAADPTMVLFGDTYCMFVSMSGGFWHSKDLVNWTYKETPELPAYEYAPDVRIVNGKVLFSSSRKDICTFYSSPDPLNVPFTPVAKSFAFWDPDTFQDDDGRVYFYWGCSSSEPVRGVELDPETLQPIGEPVVVISEHEDQYGWERKGENNYMGPALTERDKMIRAHVGTKPFIEGAFMNKVDGRYYLQYAAPGTESNVYSDGVYIGEGPLGPFTYQSHNPFSSKPGGFITGAGHGSTFLDKQGNWWHVSTMRISINENFERRIGLFPCSFDEDGVLFCNQNYADYPFTISQDMTERLKQAFPELNLLSYNKAVAASSHQQGNEPELSANENVRNWWAAETNDSNAWLQMDLGQVCSVSAIQVNFADHKLPIPDISTDDMYAEPFSHRLILTKPQCTEYLLEGSEGGKLWQVLWDNRAKGGDYAHDLVAFEAPKPLRYLRISQMRVPMGGVPAVSGLRVFGKGNGLPPAAVSSVTATRENRLNILLTWSAAEGADGYNVRYGLAPEKLYNSWQVFEQNELDLSMINAANGYYIAVDSFNENGVTPGTPVFVE